MFFSSRLLVGSQDHRALSGSVSGAILSPEDQSLPLTPTALRMLLDTFEMTDLSAEAIRTPTSKYVQETVGKCETVLVFDTTRAGVSKNIGVVIMLIEMFGSHLFQHTDFAVVCNPFLLCRSTVLDCWQRMDNMFVNNAFRILQVSPQAISAFMSYRNDKDCPK